MSGITILEIDNFAQFPYLYGIVLENLWEKTFFFPKAVVAKVEGLFGFKHKIDPALLLSVISIPISTSQNINS